MASAFVSSKKSCETLNRVMFAKAVGPRRLLTGSNQTWSVRLEVFGRKLRCSLSTELSRRVFVRSDRQRMNGRSECFYISQMHENSLPPNQKTCSDQFFGSSSCQKRFRRVCFSRTSGADRSWSPIFQMEPQSIENQRWTTFPSSGLRFQWMHS